MNRFLTRCAALAICSTCWIICTQTTGLAQAQEPDTVPDVGIRFQPPTSVFLKDAHVMVSADKELATASLLISHGKILAIGDKLVPPGGAEVIDCQGKYLYPAFVDPMVEFDVKQSASPISYWNSNVTPERRMAESLQIDKGKLESLRKAGVGMVLAAPNSGIIKGQSCVLSTADAPMNESLHRSDVFQHIRLYPNRGNSERYPTSPMGAVALARQTLLDADWYQRAQQAAASNALLPRPDASAALQALEPAIRAQQAVVIDGTNELYALRGDRLAREFLLKLIIRGSGREYRQLTALAATGRTFIIPVDFPDAPKMNTEGDMLNTTLQTLMHWRLAPENPARLEQAGVDFVLTTDGLDKPTELLSKLRSAITAGLSERKALAALTSEPAQLLGVEPLVGTLEVGKLANLLVTDGPLFGKKTKIVETWVQGNRDRWEVELASDPRGEWSLLNSADSTEELHLEITGKPDKLSAKIGLPNAFADESETMTAQADQDDSSSADASTEQQDDSTREKPIEVKELTSNGLQLTGTFDAQHLGDKPIGRAWLSIVLLQDDDKPLAMDANVRWSDGSQSRYHATRLSQTSKDAPTAGESAESAGQENSEAEQTSVERPPAPEPKPNASDKENEPEASTEDALLASVACEVNYPLGAFGRSAPPEQPDVLLIKNATVWTSDEAGILEHADILVRRGIIEQVGQNLPSIEDAQVIDATGMHVSPGIIDCHSHMATDGGVNESGEAITAEVRIGDFIDSNDITIYRQLAGGVTTSNILHGSANPIGGQNQVIKLRWGGLDEDLKMREAPAGIKFALGENVKQSNHQAASSRYPQSRMGVEQLMRDRFEAALAYRQRWQHPDRYANSLPPRRDLELEALVEVLEGRSWVHCHSYRQDEILMMLRLLEGYGVTIGSLQHILEGYKVADAMAAHGATGSTFSDWWAYKIEVLDAIPYNGAVMHRAGVVVSFNSDDAELARHLNHEAAKAIKYGGVEPSEALKFVTLNPAKQLRIDRWVGSITAGKHADFVIWNRSPLSTLSVCMQTWIDGRKYFDRDQDQLRRDQDEQLRLKLIQLASSQQTDKETDAADKDPSLWWVRYDEFCHHGHEDEHDH